jgi:DNA-directed RNA polymerase sigma subunit (sigma70/sigma32)
MRGTPATESRETFHGIDGYRVDEMRSTLPLFPSDDGWPYPDAPRRELAADVPDFDALEILGPHVFDNLTSLERAALQFRFGLQGSEALTMKELAPLLGCSRAEAGELVGRAIDKMRAELLRE